MIERKRFVIDVIPTQDEQFYVGDIIRDEKNLFNPFRSVIKCFILGFLRRE